MGWRRGEFFCRRRYWFWNVQYWRTIEGYSEDADPCNISIQTLCFVIFIIIVRKVYLVQYCQLLFKYIGDWMWYCIRITLHRYNNIKIQIKTGFHEPRIKNLIFQKNIAYRLVILMPSYRQGIGLVKGPPISSGRWILHQSAHPSTQPGSCPSACPCEMDKLQADQRHVLIPIVSY